MQCVADHVLIPERLYGREREIDTLLAAFDRVVAHGTPELLLVSGFSGIGKSSVVNELHKALVPPRGLFASGKFDQYKRDIPYATLAQAFHSLVRTLLGQSEAEIGRWRDALGEALGPNRPLILVLEPLIMHSEVRNLLVVGAYRDNDVGPAHPLLRTLEAIRKTDARVHEIVLAPLGLDDVGRLVADALHCEPERARPLAQLVHEKTGGNPLFAIHFFTTLAAHGLLPFPP